MSAPRFSPRTLPILPTDDKRASLPMGETRPDLLLWLVGDTGIEPVTSSVSRKRAPAAPIALELAEVETGFEPVYTALQAVASPLGHSTELAPHDNLWRPLRADDGIRTRDPHLGKVMRYQLRYVRLSSGTFPGDGYEL
jgi:hypothetical protein